MYPQVIYRKYFRKDRNSYENVKIFIVKCKKCPTKLKILTSHFRKHKKLCRSCVRKRKPTWNKGISNNKLLGRNSTNWKGGKYISSDGYRMIKVKDRISCNSPWEVYSREHTYKIERKIGRKLNKGELVHHIDKNKLNNNISNLYLTTQQEHRKAHNSLENLAIELYKAKYVKFNKKLGIYEFISKLKGS